MLSSARFRPEMLLGSLVTFCLVIGGCGADGQGQGRATGAAADDTTTLDPNEDDIDDNASEGDESGDGEPTTSTSEDVTAEGSEGDGGSSTTTSSSSTTSSTTTEPPIVTDVLEIEDLVISESGIGPAEVGTSLEGLIEALGPGFDVDYQESIRVDIDGYVITKDGQSLFSAIDTRGNGLDLFITDNPKLSLASGLRPGTTLSDAVGLHGQPTLGYNVNNESREFVSFADGTGAPGSALSFETLVAAGIYADESQEYNETTEYRPEAKIGVIWIFDR